MFTEFPSTPSRRPSNPPFMDRRKKKNKRRQPHAEPSNRTIIEPPVSNDVTVTTVEQCIRSGITPERAGVIMYTIYNKQLYIGMAVDSASHDLTDFGGRIYYDNDPDCITGSLREFHEESLNIFNQVAVNDIAQYSVVHDNYNLIVFLHLDVKPDEVSQKFLAEHNNRIMAGSSSARRNIEVCGITWLTITAFIKAVNDYGTIYERVRKVLQQVKDWREIF